MGQAGFPEGRGPKLHPCDITGAQGGFESWSGRQCAHEGCMARNEELGPSLVAYITAGFRD